MSGWLALASVFRRAFSVPLPRFGESRDEWNCRHRAWATATFSMDELHEMALREASEMFAPIECGRFDDDGPHVSSTKP